ncbi:MAG: glycosyltransferase family 87 protein [Xanthobacteraceae bacterium]
MSSIDPVSAIGEREPPAGGRPVAAAQSPRAPLVLRLGAALALVAFVSFWLMWVQWQMAEPGISTISGDFVSFWTAGQLALQGHAADAYREVPLFFQQVALHHDPDDFAYVAFFYPPSFLLLCAGLALLPYFSALCVWLAASCALYATALRAMVPKSLRARELVWILFLGYPAVMVNAGFGQNGYLSTALLGGAATLLDARPALAGICLGLLSYKPQLGLIVPLALVVAGRWRCFAAAAATVLLLAATATSAFGTQIWPAFLANMTDAQHNWMQAYNPLYLRYWTSVYGAVRLHDGALALAYVLQTAVSLIAASMLVRALWRRPPGARSGRAEIAAIAACAPFCSPFMLEYDLVILALPMLWLLGEGLRDGFRRGEIFALVAVYFAPVLFKLTLFDDAIKLSVIAAALLLFAMVLRRMAQVPRERPVAAAFVANSGAAGVAAA